MKNYIQEKSEHSANDALINHIGATALEASKRAADILSLHWGSAAVMYTDKNKHDLKLDVDLLSEKAIIETITRRFQSHSILSEESGFFKEGSEYTWIVDPLDGSVNYFHSLDYFCTSISCYKKGDAVLQQFHNKDLVRQYGLPLVGVVLAPALNELYIGIKDEGVTCNGSQLNHVNIKALDETVVACNLSVRGKNMTGMLPLLDNIIRRAQKVRSFGAAALDCARVASGRLGAFIQKGIHIWDFAAARLIIELAGGEVVSTPSETAGCWDIIACNRGIAGELCTPAHACWGKSIY
ncbi:MAG: hypothetical protein JW881_05720 [Spirochaetales bacterium]|nr:hypothetical protein [Spirochaetales bacterium]